MKENKNRFSAGIVTYNPDLNILKNSLDSIVNQVRNVIVIDNGSGNCVYINEIIKQYDNATIINNKQNKGIAAALNQMCLIAFKEGCDWILTLDQDTCCPANLISTLNEYIEYEDIGILCPAIYLEGREHGIIKSEDKDYVSSCITIGSLTNLSIWDSLNGFREDFFIDFVDIEFCKRLTESGKKILRINSCMITHQLGDARQLNIFGIPICTYSLHKPWRYYYIVRNNLVYIHEYNTSISVLKEYYKLFAIILKGILFGEQKRKTVSYILHGIADAYQKKMGMLDLKG